jgi:hypothetical protein
MMLFEDGDRNSSLGVNKRAVKEQQETVTEEKGSAPR